MVICFDRVLYILFVFLRLATLPSSGFMFGKITNTIKVVFDLFVGVLIALR